jgi:hypothetical protein
LIFAFRNLPNWAFACTGAAERSKSAHRSGERQDNRRSTDIIASIEVRDKS